jgi:uncharacterized protein YbjQ (UPF0145 family)
VIELVLEEAFCCLFTFGIPIFIALVVFIIPMISGRIIEQKHFKELERREGALKGKVLIHNKKYPTMEQPSGSFLVAGEVCIGADRFKTWLAKWRQLVGGRMGSLAPVIERARREATLRMVESAVKQGCTEVGNIRFTTANLRWNAKQQKELLISVTVYGTGYSR